MTSDPRVQELLEQLMDSGQTPEEVCRESPELLTQVRECWRRLRACDAQLDALFPEEQVTGFDIQSTLLDGTDLPQIPGYQVDGVLGRGGMAIVFRARHLGLNRVVAVKMVLAGAYATPRERDRFQREAEAVAALRHPNIVQVYDVGNTAGRPYYTMEFCEGGSLAQKLAGTPQPVRQAAQLLATLAGAAQAAHNEGIVHRDLKPANVLLTVNGTPKIADFGLARRFEGETGLTRTGTVLGTPSYMAPEQACAGPLGPGPSVDIYALGAILYEMLTGRPPFRAETGAETVQQVISQEPVPPSRLNGKVPRDLETICLKCLHKVPQLRYANAADLEADLYCYLLGEAIVARPERTLWRLARRIRRRPALSMAVCIAAILAVTLFGSGLWFISDLTATERVTDEDLRDMAGWLQKSSWPEAKAALDRAKARLGDRGSVDLRRRLEQGAKDLELVAKFDAIRLDRVDRVWTILSLELADKAYEETLREAGLGQVCDDTTEVAERVRVSNVRDAIVAAFDDWAICALNSPRRNWVLEVAQKSDRDRTGWSGRARDQNNWMIKTALVEITNAAPADDHSLPLLLALAHHLGNAGGDPIPLLTRLQQAHPNDFWSNYTLAKTLELRNAPVEAIRYYQAALTIRPRTSPIYNNLGIAMFRLERWGEAIEHFEKALEIDPANPTAYGNIGAVWTYQGLHDKAIDRLQSAIRRGSEFAEFHYALGMSFEAKNRNDEALDHFGRAIALNPKLMNAQRHIRSLLIQQGCVEELRVTWAKALESNPPKHDAWYGYAELCLFLGQEVEYRRARQALLANFGENTDPYVAERTGRACLLLPAEGDELRQAAALAECAYAATQAKYSAVYPSFLLVKGLSEYRQGRFDQAVGILDTSRALGPTPRLVLAMALHRSGQLGKARETLASAVLSYDWRATQARDQDGWISHALRREAELLILPNLSAFLSGKYQPQDNNERLALLGVCQFTNRTCASARLYADAFAADPRLAEDLERQHRYNAACFAALSGCGCGGDAVELEEPERRRWREKARQWLREDLSAWDKSLNSDPTNDRERIQQTLRHWRSDADLAGIREQTALEKFSDNERKACLALWHDIGVLLSRAEKGK